MRTTSFFFQKTNGNNLIESNGFVFNNIHGIPINTHDLLHTIGINALSLLELR